VRGLNGDFRFLISDFRFNGGEKGSPDSLLSGSQSDTQPATSALKI
jgi:hypothetical protein